MRQFIEKGICIGLILFAFSIVGCSKPIPQDKLPMVVNTVKSSMQAATYLALWTVQTKAPEQYETIKGDIEWFKSEAEYVMASDVSASSMTKVLTDLIDRLNMRLKFTQDEYVKTAIMVIQLAASGLEGYFSTYTIPADVKAIAGGALQGMNDALSMFAEE